MSREFKASEDLKKELTWQEFRKTLNITAKEEMEIQLEVELIESFINTRKKKNLSQRDLSKLSGVKQPVIARIESRSSSPQIATLLKILNPIGYTLKIVPIESKNKDL